MVSRQSRAVARWMASEVPSSVGWGRAARWRTRESTSTNSKESSNCRMIARRRATSASARRARSRKRSRVRRPSTLIRQHRLDAYLLQQHAAEFHGTRDLRQDRPEQKQRFSPTAAFSSFFSPILQALPCGRSRTSALAKASRLELCRLSSHPASLAVQRQDFFSWPQAYQIKVRGHAKATAKGPLDIYLGAYVYLLRRLSTSCMEVI
jgi:hypothetical protein